ncbi:MAG: COG4315 family predicted lipoprotein [Solirubrobacterales bacterium]
MRRTYFAVGALALVALLAIAGCGGGGSSSSESTSESTTAESAPPKSEPTSNSKPAPETKGKVAVVKVMDTSDLGKVIVDSNGMTLYDFHKDKGTTSACYGECAVAWPPLLTSGEPKAQGGAEQSLLGTTKRKDGTVQVTYNGHPIYGFVEDKKPGETNGNDFKGFGAQWYALEPNGEEPADG